MIFGHQKNLKILSKIIEEKSLPHAVLFSGMDGLGKRKIAFGIAKYLQGNHQESFFEFTQKECQCETCYLVERGKPVDIIEIKGENVQISIKEIRKIKEESQFSSVYPFKIFIIDGIEKLSPSASGALLKILEEPQKNVIFFLLTRNSGLVLKTILSRVAVFKFLPLNKNQIREFLELKLKNKAIKISSEEKETIIDLSLGRPAIAEKILFDKRKFLYYISLVNTIGKIKDYSVFERMKLAESIEKDDGLVFDFLLFLEKWFEDLLLCKVGFKNFHLDFKKEEITKNASVLPKEKIKENLENIQKTLFFINFSNASRLLALENLFLGI